MDKRSGVKNFLKSYGMDYETIDMEQSCRTFMEEMERGLEGQNSSLKMLPTYITMDGEIPLEEPVIVMDAGGTNFRMAVIRFNKDKKPVMEDYRLYPMPGTRGEIPKEQFFTTIAGYIEPLLNKSRKIGFCFSYPAEMLPNKDGRLLQLSKEVRVRDLIGEVIGENLLKTAKIMGCNIGDKKIVLLNDTVATLLGGRAAYPDRVFESYIGFILGTGTNTCYTEKNCNIKKAPDLLCRDGCTIVNIESGGYDKIPQGLIDKEFDNETANPGAYKFEKMVAGKYLGGLLLKVIKKAAEDGLFSSEFTRRINSAVNIDTKHINEFLYYPYSENVLSKCCSEEEDYLTLFYIIDAVMERAAKLAAINLSSIILKTGKGKNPCKPVCITAEGTTFYKFKMFKSKLEYYIKIFLNDNKQAYCEFVKAENATLVGAAIAALMS
ncbi:MAG: hexokinase [Tepidanaerobacteraceae bacterium]|nr:hexokinase [Tepidanaerobacteraceae bacterium]